MNYDLYHDESQEGGYWHGILLVPESTRGTLLKHLELIRKETNYHHPICLKGLDAKGLKFNCIRGWIQLGVGALMQYFKNEPYGVFTGAKKYSPEEKRVYTFYKELARIDSNDKIIGAKFILFKEKDRHSKMGDLYPDLASKIETTFRMGIKGGIHWLGTKNDTIHIKSIHFDGHEHHRRNINRIRIINRISGLRDYCSLEKNIEIDDRTGRHNAENCQLFDDCQFLQLTDLLVGSFRTILGCNKNKAQKEASYPVEKLINEWQKGYARMARSRWFRGFWTSECWLEDDGWKFRDFRVKNDKQMKLL